ncbi:Maf family protein [Roseicyclus sp.]|uniref:Maf family protein n=1 Tax=Roseicyclus sp. TaxID=1914329 RepID=UPI003F9F45F0
MPDLVLASASETRRRMLESAGIAFEALPVRIDEESVRASLEAEGAGPRDVADALGEFKALKAQEKRPSAIVVGSDQVLALGRQVFGKPPSREAAAEQLAALAGRTHHLYSSAVLYHEGQPAWRTVGVARMSMHALSAAEIDAYLDVAWPGVASSVGAYHAEAYGARLFSRIEGDWFSVLGLPLLELCSFLRLRGWLT